MNISGSCSADASPLVGKITIRNFVHHRKRIIIIKQFQMLSYDKFVLSNF